MFAFYDLRNLFITRNIPTSMKITIIKIPEVCIMVKKVTPLFAFGAGVTV